MSRIALQIFLAFFLSLLAMAGIATGITAWYLERQEQAVQAQIREHAGAAAQALATEGMAGLTNWAREQEASKDSWVILIFDEWGEEILGRERPTTTRALRPASSPWLDMPVITLDLGQDAPVLINEFGERYVLSPVRRAIPSGFLGRVVQPRMLIPVMLIVITIPLSWWLAYFLTRPILDLQSTLKSLAKGQLDARVPPRTARRQDELGQLARALDDMTAKLDDLISSRERLLRDISHELRSPLARMRLAVGLLEQAQLQNPQASADDLERPAEIERLEREITRLDELIGKILELSRLENITRNPQREDLCPWLERTLQDARFEAEQAGKILRYDLPSKPLLIHGNAEWSVAALENVVRNAIRHTPPSGVITVETHPQPEGIVIQIFNEGSPIPEEYLSKIFDPFFRVDTDRGRHSGGTGLGLAIAARVMQAHGGSIEACNRPATTTQGEGVEIVLRWPPLPETQLQAHT